MRVRVYTETGTVLFDGAVTKPSEYIDITNDGRVARLRCDVSAGPPTGTRDALVVSIDKATGQVVRSQARQEGTT